MWGVGHGFHNRAERKIILTINFAEGCHRGPLLTKIIASLGVNTGSYMKWLDNCT